MSASAAVVRRVVDDRMFLRALDEQYRQRMKRHERSELLACARTVALALDVRGADVPIEGYYAEHDELTEYFRLMRALQGVGVSRAPIVEHLAEYRRLRDVVTSPLFGMPASEGMLFPTGRDSLSRALEHTRPSWTIDRLTAAAREIARASDDYSLVALASLAGDPVMLAALGESVVLYTQVVKLCAGPRLEPTYVWAVRDDLAARAARFVTTFNSLFDENLPDPVPGNAALFWARATTRDIVGRCVRIGRDDRVPPRHYHWAITLDPKLTVVDFWSDEIWTTDRYRREGGPRSL
jgi:hypothetical protein